MRTKESCLPVLVLSCFWGKGNLAALIGRCRTEKAESDPSCHLRAVIAHGVSIISTPTPPGSLDAPLVIRVGDRDRTQQLELSVPQKCVNTEGIG